jgi:hypothetical protein
LYHCSALVCSETSIVLHHLHFRPLQALNNQAATKTYQQTYVMKELFEVRSKASQTHPERPLKAQKKAKPSKTRKTGRNIISV